MTPITTAMKAAAAANANTKTLQSRRISFGVIHNETIDLRKDTDWNDYQDQCYAPSHESVRESDQEPFKALRRLDGEITDPPMCSKTKASSRPDRRPDQEV